MIAGTLEIQMLANMARLANDMSEAKSTVERSMKGIESAVASAKAALGALGIGLSVGYFVSLVKGAIDAMDHLQNLSRTTHISVEDLSGLGLAARQSGSDLDSVAQSINKLSVNMGKEPERFRALGISAKDPLEAFKQLADIYVALDDPQQKAAVAAAALGKNWAGAAPLLAEGSKRIAEMVANGKNLSGVTQENAEKARQFNEQYAELMTVLGSTRMRVVGDALPSMNEISKAMNEAAKEGGLLLTVWVGLGGALAYLLGQTEAQQTAKRLKEINEQLEVANKQLQAGSMNPRGASSSFWSFLIPDVKLKDEALAKLRETIAALEAERAKLMPPKPASKVATDGMDDAAIAAVIAAAKAEQFLNKDALYAARVAAIKGGAAKEIAEIRTQGTLTDLAFKEVGINNQRTQEELIAAQSAIEDRRLRAQLAEYTKLKAEADAHGPKGAKDSAENAALIAQTNAAIVANETITQAKIRAERTVTAQQQRDTYNAVNSAREQAGLAVADSLRSVKDIETKNYTERKSNLEMYLASAQGQVNDANALREQLQLEHEAKMGSITAQAAIDRRNFAQLTAMAQAQTMIGILTNLTASTAQKNKAMFEINKLASIANAIISTYEGANKALALGPWGIPLAGVIIAAGLANVANIASTNFGSGAAPSAGGGGPGVTPVSVAPTNPTSSGPAPSQTEINVTVTGVVTQSVIDQMIDQLRDEIGNKDAIIIPQNSRQAANLAG